MPNIAVALREEIAWVARKEIRIQMDAVKKASSRHRSDIAELKRQIAKLERQVTRLQGSIAKGVPAAAATPAEDGDPRVRFTAKGLRSQRKRLELTAAQYSVLVGVTPQSIYNWERGVSCPRKSQLSTLAALRGIGKKEVAALLKERSEKQPTAERKPVANKKPIL